jgi:DNA processing protein
MNNCNKTVILTQASSLYPDLLRHIHNPPRKIFYRGDMEIFNKISVAFVGTRKFTPYGELVVDSLVSDLSLCDVVIVSGLARGIDTLAHEAAIKYGLKTAAILGTGVNNIYPSENKELAEEIIAKGGCVLSEYPDDLPVKNFNFPMRNRIIAGLSVATVVVEAPESSGALITAKVAIEEGRDVFAVPGDIDRLQSLGCNNLIKSSAAKPCLSGTDIIAELKIQPSFIREKHSLHGSNHAENPQISFLDQSSKKVLETLSVTRPMSTEQIIKLANLPLRDAQKALSLLELNELIYSTLGGLYLKKKRNNITKSL